MTQFEKLLARLVEEKVEFVIIGGFAAAIHGALRPTQDLDIVYRRTSENIARLVRALQDARPYPRGAPPGLPFRFDVRTIEMGTNFTLDSTLGLIDLLGHVTGGGTFDELLPFCRTMDVFGRQCLCLDLAKLIEVKRAAGRPKDFEAIAELELLHEAEQEEE